MILLPGHYEFTETLANLPFFYNQVANNSCEVLHLIQKSPNYVPEITNINEVQEYLLGGEADQFVEYVDGYANDGCTDELEESEDLPYSWELGDEWLGSI